MGSRCGRNSNGITEGRSVGALVAAARTIPLPVASPLRSQRAAMPFSANERASRIEGRGSAETRFRLEPLSVFETGILAPGMAAPGGSVTAPMIVAKS